MCVGPVYSAAPTFLGGKAIPRLTYASALIHLWSGLPQGSARNPHPSQRANAVTVVAQKNLLCGKLSLLTCKQAGKHKPHMTVLCCVKSACCDRILYLQIGYNITRIWESEASTCMQRWQISFCRRKEAATCTCLAATERSVLTVTAC